MSKAITGHIDLYKALSPEQLALLIRSNWRRFSPDIPQQKNFYPKLNRGYAEAIARQWHAVEYSAGFVVRFRLPADFIKGFELQTVGYDEHLEYKVPIAALERLNHAIIGSVELLSAFTSDDNLLWQRLANRAWLGFH
ncbi:hypothetical protein NO559_08065 [Dasania sp. GY-MA-18]|uniref:Uncharacterized protein n=1 Tax=Dasania phycosphaerae TaxID=2950436 RepID=A0A9J6RLT2_9GAMM|nr:MULTISPECIES: hypothetical protein [Dasania]MCR8922721.1 hypothetical protein [Dasania sp. GY-MA-18]MCZ0865151.1 hypothetical protein [Dasania phycosphaerae]MCZ0868877.1 hypothetical protein [Dasania phycosphaerae]